ncbi:hypothetical protein AGABI1DRAFT_134438 [Agaricus bisporus var. burnettii JB137-S8]|uniref:Uncharacterized protein n=1 Tax=Agaricus bisporus var. burnettii (strain JB137-S8 / ATCC MYA-4627 / FGSC 10392) TaxID=597362 RepID=K5WSB1_AGABU|nr:uncharacterized protein AGABI1DRAFT_134438 [Agaricus bisporus var. burnettii JB137-S8]EKM73593.1 hypothetical protein AGABI1DRAFT_134438 [Agaricus bisporus var. burnettii JB137-S8]
MNDGRSEGGPEYIQVGKFITLANAKELITAFHQLYGELNRIHHVLRDTGFQERELPNRFTAKALFGWDDKQFDAEYLKKLERNWRTWRS